MTHIVCCAVTLSSLVLRSFLSRRRSKLGKFLFADTSMALYMHVLCSHLDSIVPLWLQEYVRCLRDGEAVSVSGTHLGHNLRTFFLTAFCDAFA